TSSSRLYLLFMSDNSGPMVPGFSPPLITWQVRQLPLLRSKASFCPSAVADWACAEPAVRLASSASTGAKFLKVGEIKAFSGRSSMVARSESEKHKAHQLAMRTKGAATEGVNRSPGSSGIVGSYRCCAER